MYGSLSLDVSIQISGSLDIVGFIIDFGSLSPLVSIYQGGSVHHQWTEGLLYSAKGLTCGGSIT